MLYLHKLLPLVFSPLGLVLGLLFLGVIFKKQWPIGIAILILLLSSFPLTARGIWYGLESTYPYQSMASVPRADAVVVLGGMLGGFETDDGYVTEWSDPDRFFVGLRLVQIGRADRLVFTRAQLPWADGPAEGELLREKALEMGIPAEQILLTAIASNTEEESLAVRDLAVQHGLNRIILVSSSYHLPRAKLLFEQAGVEIYPFPTDFKSVRANVTWLDLVPSADALSNTSSGLREYIGRLYYRFKFNKLSAE